MNKLRFTGLVAGVWTLVSIVYLFPSNIEATLVTDAEQAWIDEHASEFSFAPIKDYPPFLWSQYGVLFGISYDYLNYIQEKLSVNFQKREPRTRSEIITALKSGETSFVSSLTETTERSDYLLFTRPYISIPTIYVGKSGSKVKTGLEIVEKELRVSVSSEYGVHTYLRDRYPDMLLVPVENNYIVLQNVITGVTEVGVLNIASLMHLVREHQLENLKKIANTGFEVRLAFAVPKSMPELRNILDNIIESMPSRTKDAIVSRWITDHAAIQNLAGASLADINSTTSDNRETYLAGMGALLLFCLGFILHYMFVRFTPRKDSTGHAEFMP